MLDSALISLFSFPRIKNGISMMATHEIFKDTRIVLLLLFILGVSLRIMMYFLIPNFYTTSEAHLGSDSLAYYFSAMSGAENGMFSTYWPPGFPFFISIFYLIFKSNSTYVLTFVLTAIGVLVGIVAYYISLKLFKNKLAALLAFFMVCIQPSFLMHSPQILSDTLAVFIFALGIYYMLEEYLLNGHGKVKKHQNKEQQNPKTPENLNRRFPLIIGILVGFLILIRPNYIFLVVPYFLLVIISPNISPNMLKIKAQKLALFALALFLTLTPWLLYTEATLGEPVISTNGGVNFYIGNNPGANGRYMEPYGLNSYQEGYQKSINYIISNPFWTITLYVKKTAMLVLAPYILPWELPQQQFSPSESFYSYGMNIGFLIFEIIGIRGLILLLNRRTWFIFFISIILLANLTFMLFFVDGRLLLPLLFIYIIMGSYYIVKILETALKSPKSD